jgi:hypothetical protein
MTDISNEIVSEIKEAKANYIKKNFHAPSMLIVNPYVAAAIRECKGISELFELNEFEGMGIAYIMDTNGEEFRLI